MGVEIERKFLVNLKKLSLREEDGVLYRQGYLHKESPSVRVRLAGDKALLTVKGDSEGIMRAEFEYEIPRRDALQMLQLFCGNEGIEKTHYTIPVTSCYGDHTWEVDVFHGANEGLVVAEVELTSEDEQFPIPKWITQEVTGDPRYLNVNLTNYPYTRWVKK